MTCVCGDEQDEHEGRMGLGHCLVEDCDCICFELDEDEDEDDDAE
ncbi:MAG TPA: hypothetical protein VJQ25_11205 [Nitrospira sp.]|nr:hypothetical protein [Nitrospira sp.]